MTYSEAIQFLYDLQLFGAKFGLENTSKLAKLAGNPQASLRFIHVAGTNGKGSTCAMLESVYRQAGLRVGLFTSPHLVHFGERIQVNRQLISETEIIRLVTELKSLMVQFPADNHPTFFEVVTTMALKHFAAQKCDLVIWETGMGGRLDATNIVTPLASVITNIQFDHQLWLGNTLAKIAAEKAGIIKPGVPVITAVADGEAGEVLRKVAKEKSSPMYHVTRADAEKAPLKNLELPLHGEHQRLNAAVVVKTIEVLENSIPITESQMVEGLKEVRWQGRLQTVALPGGRTILLDGAHNVGGAEALRNALQKDYSGKPFTLVLGMLIDKDCSQICDLLCPLTQRIVLTPVKSKRSASPAELMAACRKANPEASIVESDSLKAAMEISKDDLNVVIAGSLYLIGEAMELLNLASPSAPSEGALNEWGGKLK